MRDIAPIQRDILGSHKAASPDLPHHGRGLSPHGHAPRPRCMTHEMYETRRDDFPPDADE
jgi:hypothetical protein